jgi:hypothetical protein
MNPDTLRINFIRALTAAWLTAAAGCSSEPTSSSEMPAPGSGLRLETISTDFDQPVYLTSAPGDPPTRLFVVEKDGRIRILDNGVILPAPFLDLTSLTTKLEEQGLLGLAFAPDYETSGRFYVSYTALAPHREASR